MENFHEPLCVQVALDVTDKWNIHSEQRKERKRKRKKRKKERSLIMQSVTAGRTAEKFDPITAGISMSRSHSPITNSCYCDTRQAERNLGCSFAMWLLKQTSNRPVAVRFENIRARNGWQLLVSGARPKIAGANFITVVSETVDYCRLRFKRYWTTL